jgi:pentatricopeptide repeat protein
MKKFDMSPSVIHINNLLRVYNHAGQPSKTVELLHDMLVRGMSPDATTYSIALRACSELENTHQARQEVRSIWKQIVNRLQPVSTDSSNNAPKQPPVEIDDTLVTSLLIAISRTSSQEADITTGIDIIQKLYSLYPAGAASMINKYALSNKSENYGFGMQPSPKVLDAILRLCGKLRQHALGMEYYELALQQFSRLKLDQHVKKSHMWLKKQERKRLYEMKKRER